MSLKKIGVKIIDLLAAKKHQAFFVGGFVRDTLLKRKSDNLDIATDAKPSQVEKILKAHSIHSKPVGKKFGTILAATKAGPVEITTFRAEGNYADSRHPAKVIFVKDYRQDAKRRDFTINAMYFDPLNKKLYDPVNGSKDLRLGIIRFVGDAKKRIDEDHLRMLRAVRLATQLGFKLEKNTFAAIKTRSKLIQDVSGERVKIEMDKILLSASRTQGLKLLSDIGLLRFISPELEDSKKVFHKSRYYHLEGDGLSHALLVADALKIHNIDLIYAALFHDVGKVSTGEYRVKPEGSVISYKGHVEVSRKIFDSFAKRLRFPAKSRKWIDRLIELHDKKIKFYEMTEEQQVHYALQPNFDLLLDLWNADLMGNVSTKENEWYRKPRFEAYRRGLKILKQIQTRAPLTVKLAKGELIMRYANLKPGIELGRMKDKVKAQVILGKIKNLVDLKNFLTSVTIT
ncbi:MAG: CCA tRNA nucleotidyltransferase [Candidatus Doudnabacteria bacterium]|nr:CCA tRNA nucleotidyltransferase [Candidatus Doudnabacteria bacterium]